MAESRRIKRVAELIREEMSRILTLEMSDPRVKFVTVTGVHLSPDMRTARILITVLGGEAQLRTAFRGLKSAQKRIRGLLGERLDLRLVPELIFHEDAGVKHSLHISNLLTEIARDREADNQPEQTPGEEGATLDHKAEIDGS